MTSEPLVGDQDRFLDCVLIGVVLINTNEQKYYFSKLFDQ